MLPFELTKDTPYLALSGELWSVFYEYFNRNWPCYKGFLLYLLYQSLKFVITYRIQWLRLEIDQSGEGITPFVGCFKYIALEHVNGCFSAYGMGHDHMLHHS